MLLIMWLHEVLLGYLPLSMYPVVPMSRTTREPDSIMSISNATVESSSSSSLMPRFRPQPMILVIDAE